MAALNRLLSCAPNSISGNRELRLTLGARITENNRQSHHGVSHRAKLLSVMREN